MTEPTRKLAAIVFTDIAGYTEQMSQDQDVAFVLLEEKQSKDTVKKYGSTDSGALLGDILGPLLKKKNPKNNK